MRLRPDDHTLSMRISQRGKIPSSELRTLIVHRLTDTLKAVLRRSLNRPNNPPSVHCEPCGRFIHGVSSAIPQEWQCPHCQRRYRAEVVIYEALPDDEAAQ